MPSAKNKGRQALDTPTTAHSTAQDSECSANDPTAQPSRDASAQYIGNALRALRHAVTMRLCGAPAGKILSEVRRAGQEVSRAEFVIEYEIRERGEV